MELWALLVFVLWPSFDDMVCGWVAAKARFIRISLHSSAVKCIGPIGLKCVLLAAAAVDNSVWALESTIPFDKWDWSDGSTRRSRKINENFIFTLSTIRRSISELM